jgi:hypothetical protein
VDFFFRTPQCQIASLDLNSSILNNSPGSPLTRARKALLLATNHQEMSLTTSPRSPLTMAKKALQLGIKNWSACAVWFCFWLWLNLYGLSCMAFEPYYGCYHVWLKLNLYGFLYGFRTLQCLLNIDPCNGDIDPCNGSEHLRVVCFVKYEREHFRHV